MKKIHIYTFLLLNLAVCATQANWQKQINVALGQRVDNVQWSIAGNNVNVLSELTWSDVKSNQLLAGVRFTSPENLVLYANLGVGIITAGKNQDSDYGANNRQDEISRSNNDANSGSTFDIGLGLGQNFYPHIGKHRFRIAPVFGFNLSQQYLKMTNGYQSKTSSGFPPIGPFIGLNSSYTASWRSIYLGYELQTRVYQHVGIETGLQIHAASFVGDAVWNLRSDFSQNPSFRHEGSGLGLRFNFALLYRLNKAFGLSLNDVYQDWRIKDGTDTTYFSDGTVGTTKLNDVSWYSNAILLGLQYSF